MSFFDELKRRGVFRVAIGYVGVSWLILQVIDVLFGIFDYETDVDETIVIILAIGFVPAMILAWIFELTPEGLKRDVEVDRTSVGKRRLDGAGPGHFCGTRDSLRRPAPARGFAGRGGGGPTGGARRGRRAACRP